ncbi:MAG: 5'/3'-nucleotidase SurE [Rhodobacterales bacterium]|nr:5'/3'-nucleotidase SurE [Rhodobacterales bacterium]
MHLLLSNDDGFYAAGFQALTEALTGLGTTWRAAPTSERSAQSHALTMHKPLFARIRDERSWAITGTPADCVYLALQHLMPHRPDVVVSGINRGSNVGHDVHYSGTVAAAREGCLQGVPSVSVSLHLLHGQPSHWASAGHFAARVVQRVLQDGLPDGVHLNVNVPDLPLDQIRGLRTAPLGTRNYGHEVDVRTDPRGRPYYWIGGQPLQFEAGGVEDGPCIQAGWATVTPLTVIPNHTEMLEVLRGWTDA